MNDQDFDPQLFATGSGVWHIVDREHAENAAQQPGRVLTGQMADGRKYMVALTDADLAEQLIQQSGLANAVPVRFVDQSEWFTFLQKMLEYGHEYIGFDPRPNGKFADFGPIADLIDRLREAGYGQE